MSTRHVQPTSNFDSKNGLNGLCYDVQRLITELLQLLKLMYFSPALSSRVPTLVYINWGTLTQQNANACTYVLCIHCTVPYPCFPYFIRSLHPSLERYPQPALYVMSL